jgi:hypothetical protein
MRIAPASVSLALAAAALAEPVSDPVHGLSYELPPGWPPVTEAQAWGLLDSLEVDAAVRPDWQSSG